MSAKHTLEYAITIFAKNGKELLADTYESYHTPMPYICGGCGELCHMSLANCIIGKDCKECGIQKQRNNNPARHTLEHAITIFAKNGKQLLADTYENARTPMPYVCGGCGELCHMSLDNCIRGMACRKCGRRTPTLKIYPNESAKTWKEWMIDKRRGVNCYGTYHCRISNGMCPQEAFELADNLWWNYTVNDDVRKPDAEWARELGISSETFRRRNNPQLIKRNHHHIIRKCQNCKQIVNHYTVKGLCSACYKYQRRRKLIVCKNCNRKIQHFEKGLCCKCYKAQRPLIICIVCKLEKPHHSHNLCNACYRHYCKSVAHLA